MFVDDLCGALCAVKLEAEVVESLCGLRYLALVGVADGYKHAALNAELVACGDKTLVQSLFEGGSNSQHLARGLHLGT